jgi:hypothetical protein
MDSRAQIILSSNMLSYESSFYGNLSSKLSIPDLYFIECHFVASDQIPGSLRILKWLFRLSVSRIFHALVMNFY